MRNQAIKMMRAIGNFAGGCNVQFAVNPADEQIIAIEINPRVSRSSALASKATGYPIAKIAAKLAIGYNLDEIENQITKTTSAYFEPTLDYVIVKVPRWNFDKFKGANRQLGLQMKSVGEVMAIGRSFIEALQKACQSLEIGRWGLGADGRQSRNLEEIMHSLENPSWDRLFHIYDALSLGVPIESVRKATKIDRWFLNQIQEVVNLELELRRYSLNNIPPEFFFTLKQKGFSDAQIAHILTNVTEEEVYQRRIGLGIRRVYKMVDTCAAEFPAKTPYFYSTYEGENESVPSDKKKIIVLGSGPNRIGQGIEFDYSCVHGLLAAKESGFDCIYRLQYG
jgi:carbamoyl-phosphate synthase large subunit